MSKPTTCIIAEDEALFSDALSTLLKTEWPSLDIIAICEDGAAALEAIGEAKPDVVFLDIRMPGLTGLDVAGAMADVSPETEIVFVTAYNQHAIDAFEKGAIDYLLKPVSRERLANTIKRIQSRLASRVDHQPALSQRNAQAETIAAIIQQLEVTQSTTESTQPLIWLTASTGKETRLIMIDDVIYFQSDSKYTAVMTAQGETLLRTPIQELIARLDAKVFRQIHRGTIVNMRAVAAITRDASGRGTMKLKNRPETLTVSLTFMPLFKNM